MRPNIQITAIDNQTGEIIPRSTIKETTDYMPPTRTVEPPAPKHAEPTLDELRVKLTDETLKLQIMSDEHSAMEARRIEVARKITATDADLMKAQAAAKNEASEYARGRGSEASIKKAQATAADLISSKAALEAVAAAITEELQILKEPLDAQKRLVDGYHDSAWRLVAELEKIKAEPFLQRSHFAFQQLRRAYGKSATFYHDAIGETVIPALLTDYELPGR